MTNDYRLKGVTSYSKVSVYLHKTMLLKVTM